MRKKFEVLKDVAIEKARGAMKEWAILPLRLGLGVMFALHGAQKIFGIFGGRGMQEFTGFVKSLGFVPPELFAYLAAYGELVGGILLIVGLCTRVASVYLMIFIIIAGVKVHLAHGFFLQNGGVEYVFIIACSCLSLAVSGSEKMSITKKL